MTTTVHEENAARLRGWANDIDPMDVETVLEWLDDREMLTDQGEDMRHAFWELYISEVGLE